jgi:kinesin family protein C2/C3
VYKKCCSRSDLFLPAISESTREAYQALRKKPGLISKIQNVQIQNIQQLSPSGYLAKVPSQTALTPQSEVDKLRSKLAMETAARRKLLNEVQDLRGAVRVYCRLRAPTNGNSILSVPAHEVVLLHRERAGERIPNTAPLSFEFDGVIASDMDQHHLYSEVEELCLNALDGFNVCVIVYGQSGSGKTFAMLGDVGYSIAVDSEPLLSINDFGIHLRAAKQIFSVLKYRSGRFKDVVTFSIVEVYDERISDLLAGTEIGESQGRMESRRSSSRRRGCSIGSSSSAMGNSEQPIKLEIRTNHKGETVVQGSLSVEVKSFEEICRVWKECLGKRVSRLAERGVKLDSHDRNCHIIGTMRVFSTNLSTGVGTQGKIQFVDLAGSDVVSERSSSLSRRAPSPGRPSGTGRELKYSNKSIATLSEVVHARSQYQRTVPYRNSTITHLLSDSLEGDTKVAMVACVSSDLKDLQETACTLKLAQSMRKVIVGKATKHALGRGRS